MARAENGRPGPSYAVDLLSAGPVGRLWPGLDRPAAFWGIMAITSMEV